MIEYNTAVVLAGAGLLGASAGVVGNYAVLRRRALTGDALAHATLPGLCLAFLLLDYLMRFPAAQSALAAVGIVDSRNLPALLIGALCTGVLGVGVITALRRWTRVKEDAAIGIVLGVFFGAGIVLVRVIQNHTTAGSKAGLDSFILGKAASMILADVLLIGGTGAACIAIVLLLYKEFKLTVFDPGFAKAQGWPVVRLDLLLMSLIAVAVVVGLPAVGAVLIAALLILPSASARFWTDRFGKLLWLSAAFGMVTGVVGTALSAIYDKLAAGPIIILTGTTLFLASVLLAPRRGLVARAIQRWSFRRQLSAGTLPIDLPSLEQGESAEDESTDVDDGIVAPLVVGESDSPPVSGDRRDTADSVRGPQPAITHRRPADEARNGRTAIALAVAAVIGVGLCTWWLRSLPSGEQALATWAIVIACLTNIPCAVLGCYLVLRRMSLLGDAISHSVLPGIAIAFLLTGQLTGLPIVLGATVLGVLTAVLTQTLHVFGRVPEDSSMGVVYSSLFALGVIMISGFAVDLDPGCVLYGLLEFTPLDTIDIAGLRVPRVVPTLVVTCIGTLLFVVTMWKELKISSFDAALASAMGINATLVHYLLMALVAAVVVAAFDAVGSILVVAMLIVPAATAHLLADRLGPMIVWSVVVAVVSSVVGYAASRETNAAGMMAVVAGAQFTLAVFFAPRHGLLSRWLRNFQLSLRIAAEDVIGMLYRAEEDAARGQRGAAECSPADARSVTYGFAGLLAIPHLRRRGQVRAAEGGLQLTDSGRELARSIIRSHRLWEAFLGEQTDLPLDHLHAPAERMEHFIGRELQEKIAATVAASDVDPHGREIPPETRPAADERVSG